nr:integrase, catalytic region, zinc finger, CCHC-type, peptidase aspartic, catalytic [Tanacetum cinerariifolium]
LQRQHSELLAKFQAQEVEINSLKERVKNLEDNDGVIGDKSRDDAPIKGRSTNEGEAPTQRIRTDSEEIARVLTSMDAATVLAGETNVPRKDFSKSTSVTQSNVSNDFSKPVTAQTLPTNKKSYLKNTNVLAPGIPQLKSNPLGDRVLHSDSRGKKLEVEEHRRNVKLSKNKTSITAFASESNNKPRNFARKIYENVSKTYSWWYPKFIPSGYIWKPKSGKENVNLNVSMPLEKASRTANVMDTMTSRRTVKFWNDQIAPILGYGDLVQGAITIKRVYYVEGLNHNLFSVGQFCDADLEVAFRKSTCFIRDLKGNDLLTGSRETDLYSITLQGTNAPNLICLMAKATSS